MSSKYIPYNRYITAKMYSTATDEAKITREINRLKRELRKTQNSHKYYVSKYNKRKYK